MPNFFYSIAFLSLSLALLACGSPKTDQDNLNDLGKTGQGQKSEEEKQKDLAKNCNERGSIPRVYTDGRPYCDYVAKRIVVKPWAGNPDNPNSGYLNFLGFVSNGSMLETTDPLETPTQKEDQVLLIFQENGSPVGRILTGFPSNAQIPITKGGQISVQSSSPFAMEKSVVVHECMNADGRVNCIRY